MGEYKFKQITIRMKYNTFLRLKKQFPAMRKESCSEYFERLAKMLETYDGLKYKYQT